MRLSSAQVGEHLNAVHLPRLEGENICVMQGTPDFVSPEVNPDPAPQSSYYSSFAFDNFLFFEKTL